MGIKYRVKGRKIPDFLYHWAPRSRRKSILRHGLKIGRRNYDCKFRPQYLCFSNSPARSLTLVPHFNPGTIIDLYEVWPMFKHKVYRVPMPKGCSPEWRITHDIPKSRFKYIGSRKL